MNPNSQVVKFLAEDRIGGFKQEAAARRVERQAQGAPRLRRRAASRRVAVVMAALTSRLWGLK